MNAFKGRDASESIIWQSRMYSVSPPKKTQTKWCCSRGRQTFQTKISILCNFNTSKDLSTLTKPFSNHSQPMHPHPDLRSISTAHFFHLQHQLVFSPCPLQNSVPSLDLTDWLCADPAKKQRHPLCFNYSCAMRGSGSSPLLARKRWLLHQMCLYVSV